MLSVKNIWRVLTLYNICEYDCIFVYFISEYLWFVNIYKGKIVPEASAI